MYTKADKEKGAGKFNLSELNLNYINLVRELNELLEKPNPKTLIQKWWQAKHFPYDQERINHITLYIEKINLANQSILNLQSKLMVNEQVLRMMTGGTLVEAERLAEKQLAAHANDLQKIEDEQLGACRRIAVQSLSIHGVFAITGQC